MMGKKKYGFMGLAIYIILFAVYNMIIFLVFNNRNHIFWISYGFFVAAFLLHMICVAFSLKNMTAKAAFFGIPLISFSNYFVLAELFVSLVFMIFRGAANVKLCVALQVILLAVFLIVAIVSLASKSYTSNVTERIEEDVRYIQNIRGALESLMQQCQHPQAKEMLRKASEAARYANQKSSPSVQSIDDNINYIMQDLQKAYNNGDLAGLDRQCTALINAFSDRNRMLGING